jgi:hypothetical protein
MKTKLHPSFLGRMELCALALVAGFALETNAQTKPGSAPTKTNARLFRAGRGCGLCQSWRLEVFNPRMNKWAVTIVDLACDKWAVGGLCTPAQQPDYEYT